jgi:type I restriction enzyme S subunit
LNLVALGDIANFSQGLQIPIPDQKKDKFPGSQLFLRIINYTQKSTDFRYVSEQKERYIIEASDIIMVRYGAVGYVGRGLSGILANNMFKIDFNERIVDGDYLYRSLKSDYVQIQLLNGSQSTSMAAINFKSVAKVKLPLPPLEEQKKIAAILDAADEYRRKTKSLIAKYDELTQSLFLDMFGELEGDKVSLSSICEVNPKKSQISSLDRTLKVSFVPMTNVSEEGGLSLVEERTIDEVWSGFTYFQENDVVFAKITPCMENGKGTIMRGLKNEIGFGTTEFHVLRPTNEVSCSEYLFYLTHSSHFRVLAELNMKGSAGQKRVPKDFFDRYKVVAPSIALQNQFAERVRAVEAQKVQAQASLVQAEDLFSSLLQRAFKGELIN